MPIRSKGAISLLRPLLVASCLMLWTAIAGCDFINGLVDEQVDSYLISLEWDSSADLDLVVTSSSGQRIYAENDVLRGPGTERVSLGSTPSGSYSIRVDHYTGPAASYRVRVETPGESESFTGTVSEGGTASVATLNLGGGSGSGGSSGQFAGEWRRYGNPNGYDTAVKVGGISGEPASRVYMCTLPPTPSPGLYKGTLQGDGATIRWDSGYNAPDYLMRSTGSSTMEFYVPSYGSVGGSYRRGDWPSGACGLSL